MYYLSAGYCAVAFNLKFWPSSERAKSAVNRSVRNPGSSGANPAEGPRFLFVPHYRSPLAWERSRDASRTVRPQKTIDKYPSPQIAE